MGKGSMRIAAAFAALVLCAAAAAAQNGRKAWSDVAPPAIARAAAEGDKLVLAFVLVTGTDGADKASVELIDGAGKVVASKLIGKSKNDEKRVEFAPSASGRYRFRIAASRTGEAEPKRAESPAIDFALPLVPPAPRVLNAGGGAFIVKWQPVPEAEAYEVAWDDDAGKRITAAEKETSARISGLEAGRKYEVSVTALRGSDRSPAGTMAKTCRDGADREWNFTWFGQSTKGELNAIDIIDADDLKFRLYSCSVLPDGQIDQKGGKFTTFHDGISYYYTTIDPDKENFELSATFTVDYINPTPDGQEGFGIVAMDSLGEQGVSARNHYTNSAGIIATKFEATVGGVKKTSKDTLGARFVSGIDAETLAMGDSGIAERGENVSRAFSYESDDLIRQGASYRITLKKTNTGYHAIWKEAAASGGAGTSSGAAGEYVMYGPDKLRRLAPDKIYVGFAVARGCNVTVRDVSMTTTDPRADPPAREEPPELVPLTAKVDSPETFTEREYPLVFTANADGRLSISDGKGKPLAADAPIRAGEDYEKIFVLANGTNEFTLQFKPDPGYRPGRNKVMAVWDKALGAYAPSVGSVSIRHAVTLFSYPGKELRVAPDGSPKGTGTEDAPLDLATALAFAKAGQPIVLSGGTYFLKKGIAIGRGNDGRPDARKTLISAPEERAALDFGSAAAGMQVWGDFWTIEGIDIRNTPGNVKGLQIGGNGNIVRGVAAYKCGDTGIQISGNGSDKPEKWPSGNLVEGCVSHDNMDPAANNADGFAAKLTCGGGNVFRGCIAYSNIDDGWDLFSKIETGPIGAVTIEGCVAYRNGSLSDGSGNGDGNGFKLGGDGISVPHTLRNSVAFANGAAGITSNSDPSIIVERCTSFGNGGANIALYGKGNGERNFVVSGIVSMKGGTADVYREMPSLASPANYFWDGAKSANSLGERLGTEVFVSVDTAKTPELRADGSIDMKGLLATGPNAPQDAGAALK